MNEIFIRKELSELLILFKRVWLYFENIKYIVDKRYILSRKIIEYFHRHKSIRADCNLLEENNILQL